VLLALACGEYATGRNRRLEEGRDGVQEDTRSGQPRTQSTNPVLSVGKSGVRPVAGEGYGDLFGGKGPNLDLKSGFCTATMATRTMVRLIEFLAKKSITKMDYRSDLAPLRFFEFSKIKKML
jgi:hypothetical protein